MAKGIYGFLLLFLVFHANAAKPVGHPHDQVKPKQPQQLVQTEAGGEDDASMDILTDSIKSLFGSDAQAPPMPAAQPAAASAKTVKTATVAAAAAAPIKAAVKTAAPVVAATAQKPAAPVAAPVKAAVKAAVHATSALEKKAVVKPEEKPVVSKPVVAAAAKKPVSKPVSKPVVAAAAKKPVAKPLVAAAAKKAEAKPVSKPAKAAAPVAKVSAAAPKEVPAVPKALLKKEAPKEAAPAPKATPKAAAKVTPAAPAVVAAPAVKAAVKVVAAEAPKPKATAPANATHFVAANATANKTATNATAAANKTEVSKSARLTMGVSGHLAAAPAAPLATPPATPPANKTITALAKGENATTAVKKEEEAVKKAEVDDLPMAKLFVDDDPTPAPPVVVVNATANKTVQASTEVQAHTEANTTHPIAKTEKNLTAVNSTIVNTTAAFVKKVQNSTAAAAAVKKVQETKEQQLEAEVAVLKAKLAADEAAKAAKITTALKVAAAKHAVKAAAKAKHTAPKPHQQAHAAPKAAAHKAAAPKPPAEHKAAAVHHAAPKHAVAHVAAPASHDLDAEEKLSIKKMLRNRVHKAESPLKKFLKSLNEDYTHEQRTARPHHFNAEREEYRHAKRSRYAGLIKVAAVVTAPPQEATAAPQANKVWSAPTTVQPAAPVQLAAEEATPAPQQTGFFGRLFSPITSFFSWMTGSKTAVAVHPAHSQLSLLSQPVRQPKQDPSYTAWQTADAKMRLVEISDEWGRREQVDEDQVERIRDIDHTERVQAETKAQPQKVISHANGESHATSFWSTLQGQDQEIETSLKMDSLQKYQQLSRIQDEQVKHAVSVSDREALKMTMAQRKGNPPAESQMISADWSQAENEDKVEEQQIHDSPDLQMIQKSHFRKRVTV